MAEFDRVGGGAEIAPSCENLKFSKKIFSDFFFPNLKFSIFFFFTCEKKFVTFEKF